MQTRTGYSSLLQHHNSAHGNWRPWTLRYPFLLCFVVLCWLLVASLELILSVCEPDGCPLIGVRVLTAFDTTYDPGTSKASSFVYSSLPTLFGVMFGLLCAVIHHDCMRMEAWFQLSKVGGAASEDSLFLEYSYTFPPFVPIMAARKRHFAVLVSSCILLVASAVLTPLSAGIFDNEITTQHPTNEVKYAVIPWRSIMSNNTDNIDRISGHPYYRAYMHGWLDSALPAFTAKGYSLQPWIAAGPEAGMRNDSTGGGTRENSSNPWTGSTVRYEADLKCEKAKKTPVVVDGIGTLGYNITSSNSGLYTVLWDPGMVDGESVEWMLTFEGMFPYDFGREWYKALGVIFAPGPEYYNLAIAVEAYENITAGLYIWGSRRSEVGLDAAAGRSSMLPPQWTAIFCSPRYYESQVNATVLMPSGKVLNTSNISDRTPIPATPGTTIGDVFREYQAGKSPKGLVSSGKDHGNTPVYDDSNGHRVGLGSLPGVRLDSESQILKRFGGTVGNPRVKSVYLWNAGSPNFQFSSDPSGWTTPAFDLQSETNDTLDTLLDPSKLAAMHRSGFQLHFALFCKEEWLRAGTNGGIFSDTVIASELGIPGFGVNRSWCRGSEGALVIVAMLAVVLMVLEEGRQCHLDGEPGSLACALAILHRSTDLTQQLQGSEFRSMVAAKNTLGRSGARYRLVLEKDVGPRIEVLEMVGSPSVNLMGPKLANKQELGSAADIWCTSPYSGVSFTIFFMLMMVIMAILSSKDKANAGITSPFILNSFGYKVIFSYLPTFLGIVIEPLLVTLGSHYAMFGPYMPLRRGLASSRKSLSIDYDKSPPHFQILRCIRSGDFTLGGLTISILLSNLLVVALSGVFSPTTGPSTTYLPVWNKGAPKLNGNFTKMDVLLMHYMLAGSLSGDLHPPNWTTNEYYVLPFSLPDSRAPENVTATTFGLGADVRCSFVPTSKIVSDCLSLTIVDGIYIYTGNDMHLCWRDLSSGNVNASGPYGGLSVDDPCWPNRHKEKAYDYKNLSHTLKPLQWYLPAGDGLKASEQCPGTFFAVWAEFPADPNRTGGYLPDTTISVLRCDIKQNGVGLTATVDLNGNVFDVKDEESLEQMDVDRIHPEELVASFAVGSQNVSAIYMVEDRFLGLGWYNSHLVSLHPEIVVHGRNLTHIPSHEVLPAFEDVIRRVYAIGLRLRATDLPKHMWIPKKIEAEVTGMRTKVVLLTPMVAIISGIVGYTTIVILLLYWGPQGERRVVPAPTCLAAMWAHLYASDAKEICGEQRGASVELRLAELDKVEGVRFTYGEFTGKDGNQHVGVFMESEREETKLLRDSD